MTALHDFDPLRSSFSDLLAARVRRTPGRPAARYWQAGVWRSDDWEMLASRVHALTAALIERGARREAVLGFCLPTGYPFVLADLAALTSGWHTAMYHPAWHREELAHALRLTRPTLILCDAASRGRLLEALADAGLSAELWVLIEADGASFSPTFGAAIRHDVAGPVPTWSAVDPDRAATVVFTSGTNGSAKGVVLSQKALLCAASRSYFQLGCSYASPVMLHWMPLVHAFGRLGPYLDLIGGSTGAYGRGPEHLADDLGHLRPHVLFAVPRVLIRLRRGIETRVAAAGPFGKVLFRVGRALGQRAASLPRRWRVPIQSVLRRTVFRRLHAATGGRLALIVAGGAPVNEADVDFFEALGFAVRVGFGMTETAGVAAVQPYLSSASGCGPLLPGLEARITRGGELELRGDSLLMGYLGGAAFDRDGWFATGDLARFGPDGSLHLLGRCKEIVIPETGENVSPGKLEARLCEHPWIDDACVVGDGRPGISALIVLSPAGLAVVEQKGQKAVRLDLNLYIGGLNARSPKYERVLGFDLLVEPFSPENGELTVTYKKRRQVIAARRARHVEACYSPRCRVAVVPGQTGVTASSADIREHTG